jgi:hypothetical protein
VRFVRCFLAFLIGLAAVAALLFRLLPGDQGAYAEAVANAPRCQVLFVGPSYLQVGLNVDIFEAEARRLGRELHACKFTRSALRSWELRHDIEGLLAYRWPKLERVAVDISLPRKNLGFDRENWFNQRLVYWHSWRSLPWLVDFYSGEGRGRGHPSSLGLVSDLWPHLKHMAMNHLGTGRGAAALTEARFLERLRGEGPHEDTREVNRLRKKAKPREDEYPATRAELVHAKELTRKRRELGDDAWPRELERVIRSRGFEPVFLYSPVLEHLRPPRLRRGQLKPLLFLDFEDPARFPELYEYAARGNTSHLNRVGAESYSRALAREFVALDRAP